MRHTPHRQMIMATIATAIAAGTMVLCARDADVAGYTASAPVTVRISVNGKLRDGQFVGRTNEKVVFLSAGNGQQIQVPVEQVDGVFFDVSTPRAELNDAIAVQNWGRAGMLLLPVARLLLPYLDLPQNSGVDLVADTAGYLLKSTTFRLAAESRPELSEAGVQRAKAAFSLYRGLSKAGWSEWGLVGQARAAETLLAMGKREMADALMEQTAEPFPGEAAMGSYWMVRSRMAYDDEAYADALDAAARAVCFSNKDIDVFPDALLMSARCYERLDSFYRARDIYYEVVRLFPATPAGRGALFYLRKLRDTGLTSKDEPAPLVNVFFGVQENMNKKVNDLLNAVPN